MIKAENQKKRKPFTAQDTIPYKEIYKDGICRTDDNYYSKMVQFYDINYQLAQNDDKAAIFENYCEFLNSFDSSVEVQITFLNQQVNFDEYAKNIDIPVITDEKGYLHLRILLPDAISPKARGESEDNRSLAIALKSISFEN